MIESPTRGHSLALHACNIFPAFFYPLRPQQSGHLLGITVRPGNPFTALYLVCPSVIRSPDGGHSLAWQRSPALYLRCAQQSGHLLGSQSGLATFPLLCTCSVLSSQVRGGRNVAQLVEHWTSTLLRQVRFLGVARDFSPRVTFQCRLSYGVLTTLVCNRMH